MSDQISKVFWPWHCTQSRSGFIVGWNLRGFTVCVATIITDDITLIELEQLITKEFHATEKNPTAAISMQNACRGMPVVLGEWHSSQRRDCSSGFLKSRTEMKQRRSQSPIWIHLVHDSNSSQPVVKEVSCYGYKYGRGCSMVLYHSSPHRRYSLGLHTGFEGSCVIPSPFDENVSSFSDDNDNNSSGSSLSNFAENGDHFHQHENTISDDIVEDGNEERYTNDNEDIILKDNIDNNNNNTIKPNNKKRYEQDEKVEKKNDNNDDDDEEEEDSFTQNNSFQINDEDNHPSLDYHESEMQICLEQINWAPHVSRLIQDALRSPSHSTTSYSENSSSKDFKITSIIGWRNISILFFLICMTVVRSLSRVLLTFLTWRTPRFFGTRPLYTLTASGAHLHHRLIEIGMWPRHWYWVQACADQDKRQKNLLQFYDSVLRILIDIGLGVTAGLLLRHHSSNIMMWIVYWADRFMVDVLRSHIIWLMGWPAGLKLNDELDHVLGSFSLIGIDWWTEVLRFLSPLQRGFMDILCVSGVFGLSFMLAMFSDLLALLTSHLFLFYLLSARIYSSMLRAVYSLWNLFRGKKLNVLRQRVDSADYSVDQLLLGTVVFTIFVFLFPTVAIYYTSFAFVRLFIVAVQTIISSVISIWDFMPFFSILQYCLDPLSMPGGIYLEMKQQQHQQQNHRYHHQQHHSNTIISIMYAAPNILRACYLWLLQIYRIHIIGSPRSSCSPYHTHDALQNDSYQEEHHEEVQSGVIRRRRRHTMLERIRSPHAVLNRYHSRDVDMADEGVSHSAEERLYPGSSTSNGRSSKNAISPSNKNCAYFILKSQPVAFSSLFRQFGKICTMLRRHYTFSLIARCAILGLPVPRSPPLQREILFSPHHLPPASQLWRLVQTFYRTPQLYSLILMNHNDTNNINPKNIDSIEKT